MRVAVPKETAPGERRVALVPETISKLRDNGFELQVERDAGVSAGFPDDEYASAGAELVDGSSILRETQCIACVRRPTDEAIATARIRHGPHRLPRSPRGRSRPRPLARAGRGGVRHGVDPAHHPRAVHGRAVVAGDRRRVQGGSPRRRPDSATVPDADDGGRHDRARSRPRHRCRRRGTAGDRDGTTARCRRFRVRRSTRRARSKSRASGRPFSISASGRRRPRAAMPPSSPRSNRRSSRLPWKSGFPTSTS